MEKTYEVNVTLDCCYIVKAEDEEMAKDIACERFFDCEPDFEVKEIKENV